MNREINIKDVFKALTIFILTLLIILLLSYTSCYSATLMTNNELQDVTAQFSISQIIGSTDSFARSFMQNKLHLSYSLVTVPGTQVYNLLLNNDLANSLNPLLAKLVNLQLL